MPENMDKIQIEIAGNTGSSVSQIDKVTSALKRLSSAADRANTTGFNKVGESAQRAGSIASSAAAQISSVFKKVGTTAGVAGRAVGKGLVTPIKALGKPVANLVGSFKNLVARIKQIAFTRAIKAALKTIAEGFKEGTKNAYAFSAATGGQFAKSMDRLATAFLYLKNSLGAMVMPLIDAIAPAVDFVVDKFVDFLNIINQVIAKMSGASTWTKAIKYPVKYGEATDDATKAAKKFKATILGIDEINPLNDNSDNGRGRGSDALDYTSMFETVTENTVGGLGGLSSIFDVFKQAWESKGAGVMSALQSAWTNISNLVSSVGASFTTVFTNGTGQQTLEKILGIFTNIVRVVGNLAGALNRAWNENNTGTTIIQTIADLFNDILGTVEDITGSTAEWAENLNLSPMLTGISSILTQIKNITSALNSTVSTLWKEIVLPISKKLTEEVIPAGERLLANVLRPISSIINTVKTALVALWNSILKKLVEDGVLDGLTGMLNNIGSGFADLAEDLEEKLPELEKAFQKIGDFITELDKKTGAITFIATTIKVAFETIGNVISNIVSSIGKAIGGLIDTFTGLVQFLEGVFTGDWDKAWGGIAKIAGGAFDVLVEAPIEGHFAWSLDTISQALKDFLGVNVDIKTELEKLWSGVETKVGGFWNNLTTTVTTGVDNITKDLKSFQSGWNETWEKIGNEDSLSGKVSIFLNKISTDIGGFAEKVKKDVSNWGDETKKKIETWFDNLWKPIKDFDWNNLGQEMGKKLGEAVGKAINFVTNDVPNFFKDLWDKIWTWCTTDLPKFFREDLPQIVQSVADFFKDLPGKIKEAVVSVWTKITEVGKSILDGIFEGLNNIVKAIRDWVDGFIQGFKDALGIHSPSKEFEKKIGDPCIDGIKQAFLNNPIVKWIRTNVLEPLSKALSGFWNGVTGFFKDPWGAISKGLNTLATNVSTTWNTVKNTASEKWESIKKTAGEKWSGIKSKVTGVWTGTVKWFGDVFENIKTRLGTKWESIKTKAGTAWSSIKGKVTSVWTGTVKWFGDVFENVKTRLGTKWESIKTFAGTNWEKIKGKVTDVWNNVSGTLGSTFETVKTKLGEKWDDIKEKAGSAWENIKKKIVDAMDAVVKAIKTPVNGIIGGIEWLVNKVIDGINTMTRALNKISFDIPDWVPGLGGKHFGINIPAIATVTIPRWYAQGGYPDTGELFIAREVGPELVGSIGNKSAVANNDQIVAAVASGVAEANNASNALLREQNELLRAILAKDLNIDITAGSLTAALSRQNTRVGRTIVPVGV